MNVSLQNTLSPDAPFEFLVLPFWEGPKGASPLSPWDSALAVVLKSGDFKGKLSETLLVYEGEKRLLLLGLGKEELVSSESMRRAVAMAVRAAHAKKIKTLHFVMPRVSKLGDEETLRATCDALFLTNYAFLQLKRDSLREDPPVLIDHVVLIGDHLTSESVKKSSVICSGVCRARDLVNNNADEVNPSYLADFAKNSGLHVKVLGKKEIEQEKMGLLLAVNRSSSSDPALIVLSHQGNPGKKDHIVLVGKGITYDTGGLNVKPADGMLTMKQDMSGAAVVLNTVQVAAQLGLKINVTAVVPATENAIGSKGYKQGDVYYSKLGKSVEITHTDAEGRLVLADALAYALEHLKPTHFIDVATLTGAIVIALGEEVAGLFCNNDALAQQLLNAGEAMGEPLWRMPIPSDYKELLKSDIADLINSAGRSASSITAALFLQEFCGGLPWAHLDIAGTAYLTKPKFYNTTKATGFGVRLLVDFLEKQIASS